MKLIVILLARSRYTVSIGFSITECPSVYMHVQKQSDLFTKPGMQTVLNYVLGNKALYVSNRTKPGKLWLRRAYQIQLYCYYRAIAKLI